MTCYERKAKFILNPETEAHYAIASSYKGAKFPHVHDFYELLLIVKGKQLLIINGKKTVLAEASLTLIRIQDIHYKEYLSEGLHINVAFSKETMDELMQYLSAGFPKEMLLQSEIPPSVILTHAEKKIIQTRMESLNLININETNSVKTNLRILLFELLTKYFTLATAERDDVPSWLVVILSEMKKKSNFTKGLPALLGLADIGHEHLCRLFKKHLNATPTEYINEQRINYALNLLLHTDMEIVDVCMESGFSSLSHFYHVFKERFGLTPAKYRKQFIPIRSDSN
ncbi:AraC family transcriptional regulator [Sporomusa sp.]|uniref:AraC family transcriptional regulator n=1 Tax=Sporomusa sp. TaxID=2078658 RepID=UPI002BCE1033|nr:AraC family transcriptional regulator [Sporomusa sp.]HWR05842.1 AraC family transcriptional regulator [Sporomusa sp.]